LRRREGEFALSAKLLQFTLAAQFTRLMFVCAGYNAQQQADSYDRSLREAAEEGQAAGVTGLIVLATTHS
jgi:hypothetical protein